MSADGFRLEVGDLAEANLTLLGGERLGQSPPQLGFLLQDLKPLARPIRNRGGNRTKERRRHRNPASLYHGNVERQMKTLDAISPRSFRRGITKDGEVILVGITMDVRGLIGFAQIVAQAHDSKCLLIADMTERGTHQRQA